MEFDQLPSALMEALSPVVVLIAQLSSGISTVAIAGKP
jgi:hypothetical protein